MLRSQGWAIIMVSCLVILLSAVQKTNAGVICSNLGPGGAFDHTQNHHIGSTGDTSEVVANSFIPLNDAIFSDAVVALSAGASLQQVQISLETDSLDTPGVPGGILEQFTVTVPAKSASLITAASVLNSPLTGGDMYWLVVSPSDPQHTVAGWDFNSTGDKQAFAFNDNGNAIRAQPHRDRHICAICEPGAFDRLNPYGVTSCRFATRPVLRTRPGHPTPLSPPSINGRGRALCRRLAILVSSSERESL